MPGDWCVHAGTCHLLAVALNSRRSHAPVIVSVDGSSQSVLEVRIHRHDSTMYITTRKRMGSVSKFCRVRKAKIESMSGSFIRKFMVN